MRHYLLLPTLLALALGLLAPASVADARGPAPAGEETRLAASSAGAASSGRRITPDDVRGSGMRERFACVLCAGVFLGIGGASLGGAVLVSIQYPQFVAACGTTCAMAFFS